ncbi:MAG: anti-sigma factor antagonist [Panacagrimonas sp.]|jgi:anti-anti-sigma factor|nr:STAS domain-containing protein [Panacagrimonas sp.]MCC2656446.1 anti-sigma factor antagonist [Panacagrimonas sp.]
MQVGATRFADVMVLRPIGRVDHSNAEVFANALTPHVMGCKRGGDALLFDLSQLEYISSAGLRVLMLVSKNVTPNGGKVALAQPQRVVSEILEISRFKYIFPIHATLAAGLAALSADAAAAHAAQS